MIYTQNSYLQSCNLLATLGMLHPVVISQENFSGTWGSDFVALGKFQVFYLHAKLEYPIVLAIQLGKFIFIEHTQIY